MTTQQDRYTTALLSMPVLRVVRHGDRHVVHDLVVDVSLDLARQDEAAAVDATAGPDDDSLELAVHAFAGTHAAGGPEHLAVALAAHCTERLTGVARAVVEVHARGWDRLDIGGRPRDRDLIGAANELRAARATAAAGADQLAAGFRDMMLLTSAPASAAGVTLLRLHALWTYGWAEPPYDTQWQQVRRVVTDAYAERGELAGGALAHDLAQAVLDASPAVSHIELRTEQTRRGAVDMTAFGMENTGEVFGAARAMRRVHEVALSRGLAG